MTRQPSVVPSDPSHPRVKRTSPTTRSPRSHAATVAAHLVSEKSWQRTVTEYLTLVGFHWLHVRPGMTEAGRWSTMVSGPLGVGWPDIFAARPAHDQRPARVLLLELKAEAGRLTRQQIEAHEVLRAAGLDVRVYRPSQWQEFIEEVRR